MFLIARADGKFWDGVSWAARGRAFCTIGGATRSLHEEGESTDFITVIPLDKLDGLNRNDSIEKLPTRGH